MRSRDPVHVVSAREQEAVSPGIQHQCVVGANGGAELVPPGEVAIRDGVRGGRRPLEQRGQHAASRGIRAARELLGRARLPAEHDFGRGGDVPEVLGARRRGERQEAGGEQSEVQRDTRCPKAKALTPGVHERGCTQATGQRPSFPETARTTANGAARRRAGAVRRVPREARSRKKCRPCRHPGPRDPS